MVNFLLLFLFASAPIFSEEKAGVTAEAAKVEVPRYDPMADPHFFLEEEKQVASKQPEETHFAVAILNMFLALAALIALLYAAAFIMRRLRQQQYTGQNQTSDIVILERRALSHKAALYLVEVEGEKFLIGESPEGIVPINQLKG